MKSIRCVRSCEGIFAREPEKHLLWNPIRNQGEMCAYTFMQCQLEKGKNCTTIDFLRRFPSCSFSWHFLPGFGLTREMEKNTRKGKKAKDELYYAPVLSRKSRDDEFYKHYGGKIKCWKLICWRVFFFSDFSLICESLKTIAIRFQLKVSFSIAIRFKVFSVLQRFRTKKLFTALSSSMFVVIQNGLKSFLNGWRTSWKKIKCDRNALTNFTCRRQTEEKIDFAIRKSEKNSRASSTHRS